MQMGERDTATDVEDDILVLVCTQSFTGERLVEEFLLDCLDAWKVKAKLVDEASIDWSDAGQEELSLCSSARVLLVVASTFGDGDPPNHTAEFANWLSRSSTKVPPFAVFALGDSTYQHYCAFGQFVDTALASRSGTRLLPLQTGDAQADQSGAFQAWAVSVATKLSECGLVKQQASRHPEKAFLSTGTDWCRSAIHQERSAVARITGREELLYDHSEPPQQPRRSVLHVSLTLSNRDFPEDTQPGDHVGIYSRNSAVTVDRALQWLEIPANTSTKILERRKGGLWEEIDISASELLTVHVDLTGRASPSVLRSLLPFVGTLELRALARDLTFVRTESSVDEGAHTSLFDDWVAGRRLTNLDLAMLFECRPSLQAFARACGPMQPRLYSVATVDRNNDLITIGLCIAVAEGGLCSSYVACSQNGLELDVFYRRSRFHFPTDTSPVLLVAAGSGIGPCLGFLESEVTRHAERRTELEPPYASSGHLSHVRFFFGCRTPSEILYRDRIMALKSFGLHLHCAYSRLRGHCKEHAQDLIQREASGVWEDIFVNGGRAYVCGRLELVAGVKAALQDVARRAGGLDNEKAGRIVQTMEEEGRMSTDCWSMVTPYSLTRRPKEQEHPPHVVLRLERHHAHILDEPRYASVNLSTVPAWPSYLRLLASGELEHRVERAMDMASACVACGRNCESNRISLNPNDWGECRVGNYSIVASAFPHFGEEKCLVGTKGSGTIFFGACNLKCMYCQNWELSAMDEGELFDDGRLAETMLMLQKRGCHNINFVSPTHNVAPILRALLIAARKGLKLPLIWNTGGYDSVASLRLLEGIVDIYMPDAKYASRAIARKLSAVDNYPDINQSAIKEMHRQVGELEIDGTTGLAYRGVLVRHLVLPNDLAGTCCVASFLAKEISADTFTNVMDQYRPEHHAVKDRKFGLARKPTRKELRDAHNKAKAAGLIERSLDW